MKKTCLCVLAGVMMLAVGCSSGASAPAETTAQSVESSAEETSAEETTAAEKEAGDDEKAGEKAGESESLTPEESIAQAEESLAARESSLAALEESLGGPEEVGFQELVEKAADYKDKSVKFTGEITRTAPVDSNTVQIVLAVDGDRNTSLVADYDPALVEENLKTGDTITIAGKFQGVVRYRTSSGASSMPTIEVEEITDIQQVEEETAAPQLVPGTNAGVTATDILNGLGNNGQAAAGTAAPADGAGVQAVGTPDAQGAVPGDGSNTIALPEGQSVAAPAEEGPVPSDDIVEDEGDYTGRTSPVITAGE